MMNHRRLRSAVAAVLIAVTGGVLAQGATASPLSSGLSTSAELQRFAADIASVTPAQAKADVLAEQSRLNGCVPQVLATLESLTVPPVYSSPLKIKNPTEKQQYGQAVSRYLGELLVNGAGIQGAPWNGQGILDLFRAGERVPSAQARIPASFVAQWVKPELSVNFCATYTAWKARGLALRRAPERILNLFGKGAASLAGVLGTNARRTITSWGAGPALTRTWTSEIHTGVNRELALLRDGNPLWAAWLKSTGLTAQFKRLGLNVSV